MNSFGDKATSSLCQKMLGYFNLKGLPAVLLAFWKGGDGKCETQEEKVPPSSLEDGS